MLRLKKLSGKKEESAGCSLNNAIYIKPHFEGHSPLSNK